MAKSEETVNKKTVIMSGSLWEPLRGFSRAVVVGGNMYISGTTATDEKGEVIYPYDPYGQTKYILTLIKQILAQSGFAIGDVVRTRLYVANMQRWDDYARAHREVFDTIKPASSIIQVARLMDPRLMVEVEVEAIKGVGAYEVDVKNLKRPTAPILKKNEVVAN